MADLAAALVDEYARRYLPEDTARFAYLLSRLKKSMTSLLCYLRDEQNQSQFKPVACELKIGRGEDAVPGQVYRLSDGRTVQLVGTVDRADEWIEDDGTRWVRVVDYKTGSKKLDLKEVYCGLDCQMLLYLFSLTRDSGGRFTGAQPAGVLYLLADPAPRPCPAGRLPGRWSTSWTVLCGTSRRSLTQWMRTKRASTCPLATATAHPAPTRRRNEPTTPSSAASSCIWTTLLPRWASSLRRADRRRAAGGEQQQKPLHLVRLQLYLLPRDRGA